MFCFEIENAWKCVGSQPERESSPSWEPRLNSGKNPCNISLRVWSRKSPPAQVFFFGMFEPRGEPRATAELVAATASNERVLDWVDRTLMKYQLSWDLIQMQFGRKVSSGLHSFRTRGRRGACQVHGRKRRRRRSSQVGVSLGKWRCPRWPAGRAKTR